MPSRLAAAWTAAILVVLALSATASAAVLPPNGFDGTKLDGYANGIGQINLDWDHANSYTGANSRFYFDSSAGGINQGNADAGLNIGLYDADGLGHSAVYGFRGTPMVSVNSPTPVVATGTGNPYVLTSRYTTGDCTQVVRCLQVTETVQFVNNSSSALLTWDVANISADGQPAQFRATFGADLLAAGDEGGMGRYTPSAPRLVGTINQNTGAGVELQESTGGGSPAWTHYQEDVPFQIWRQVQDPDGGSLTDSVSQPYNDKAAAVQWDTYKTSGLPLCPVLARPACAGSTAHFELRVYYHDWEPLVVTDPADPPTHTQVSVPVTARNDDNSFTDLTAAPMYYRTRPTSANVLTANDTWLQANQTTLGQATIQYTGDNPGTDVLEVWVDTDNDGVVDPNEPFRTDNIFWYDRTAISSLYTSSPRVGLDNRVNLRFVNGSNGYEARNFQYKVVDKATGTDRIPLSAVLTTSATDGNYHDPGKPAGEPGIHFTRNTPGTDVIYVYSDLDADGDYVDPGEVATREVTWNNRIDTSTTALSLYTTTDTTFRAYPYTSAGTSDSITQLRYWVTDKGVDGADQPAPALTGAYTTFPLTRLDNDPGQVVYHIYLDTNVNQVYDAGVDPIQTVTIDWILSPTNRFTVDTTNTTGTIGYSKPLDVTVLKDDGTPDTGQHVRYRITSGINPLAETPATNPDGSGHTTINVPASSAEGYDTVFMYADTNDNKQWDDNEPQVSRSIQWVPAIQIYAYDTHVPEQASATVYFRDAHGDLVDPGTYSWSVAGTAHNISSTSHSDATLGYASIDWPAGSSTATGTDILTVNAPGLSTAPKTNTAQVKFVDQVDLYPAQTSLTVGQSANIDYDLYSFSSSGTWSYTVTGANPQSGTVTYPANIIYQGVNAGDDTVTVTSPDGLWSSSTHIHWNGEALSLSGPTDTTQGAGITVHAHARDSVTGLDAPDTTLRWSIGGANPKGGKNAALTDSGGELDISWLGLKSGYDTITVYADINNDGVRQNPAEPQKVFQVHVHPVLEADDNYDSLYQGASKTVTVTYRDLSYTPISGAQLKYEIIDQGVSYPAGNPQPVTAMPSATDGSGQASITWTGVHTGNDRLKVWDDVNDNDVIDVNEPVATTDVDWASRVLLAPRGTQTRNVNLGTLNAVATLRDTAGARLANTVVHYTLTGVGGDGGTVHDATTDSQGQVTVPMTSADGGTEVLTVWQDLGTADGVLDAAAGEPNDALNLQWQATIAISNNFQTLYQGATHQTLTISGSPALSGANVRVTYNGPNSRPAEQYSVTGTQNLPNLTGNVPGTDTVHAWVDTNNDGQQNAGEAGASATLKWLPRVSLGQPTGSLEAGQQTTVVAKLLDTGGTPVAGTLKYKVTGANSVGPTSYAVDSAGAPAITYTGVNNGSDTLTVWEDANGNDVVDPGEARNSMTISWKAPSVALTPTQTSDTKFQGATSSLVVALTNNPASSGGNSGRTIRWSVSGANSTSGTATTDGTGHATIAYKGVNDGTDTVTAYADVSGSAGTRDGFDPSATMTMTWDPAVQITGGPTEDAIGGSHSETVRFVDSNGNPLVNALVIYQISGANPTNGQVLARPFGSGTVTRLNARTDGSGNATVTWTGTNPAGGTDTLDVWADADNSNSVTAGDPHASKTVTWRTASTASNPGGGTTTPIGTISQVPPGSANDFDGVPTPPAPVVAKSVNVEPVSGRVFVRLPGKKNFIELLDAEQIPVGSIVDVRKGRVALTSAQNLNGAVATAQFYSGEFQIAQKKAAKPITDLILYGGSFKSCAKLARKSDAGASQKKKIRELWGSGKGSFRTKGKYGSAAIRGTTWDVVDYCDGTLVKVTEGVVTVHDNGKNKNVTVKAKRTYFAAAKTAKSGRRRG